MPACEPLELPNIGEVKILSNEKAVSVLSRTQHNGIGLTFQPFLNDRITVMT